MTSPLRNIHAPSGASPSAFFALVESAFDRACGSAGTSEHALHLCGTDLRLLFAGTALLAPLTRALSHLAAPPARPADFTIKIWDEATSGGRLPPPAWPLEAYGARSEIAGFNDDVVHTCYQAECGALLLFHAERGVALYCTRDAAALPSYESAAPLRSILHWCMRRRGCQMVHAGAVGTAAGAVLLAGDGGMGKSTTALSCLRSNLRYLGDDYCLLELGAAPTVHSVYSSGKVHGDTLTRLPHLAPLVDNPRAVAPEKAVLLLHPHLRDALLASAPIRALALPHVTGARDTSFTAASPSSALVALAPSTHVQLPNAGAEVLRGLAPLVRRTPAFHLHLGTDISQIAPTLTRLLAAVGGRA